MMSNLKIHKIIKKFGLLLPFISGFYCLSPKENEVKYAFLRTEDNNYDKLHFLLACRESFEKELALIQENVPKNIKNKCSSFFEKEHEDFYHFTGSAFVVLKKDDMDKKTYPILYKKEKIKELFDKNIELYSNDHVWGEKSLYGIRRFVKSKEGKILKLLLLDSSSSEEKSLEIEIEVPVKGDKSDKKGKDKNDKKNSDNDDLSKDNKDKVKKYYLAYGGIGLSSLLLLGGFYLYFSKKEKEKEKDIE